MGIEQIIPRPAGEIKPYRSPDKYWEEVTKKIYGSAELPQNIRFEHDLRWNERFWSVQSARSQYEMKSFGIWSIIGGLMALGWISFQIFRLR